MSTGTFGFNVFIKESKEILVNPKSYFSAMKTSGGITEPLIKAVIYGAIAGLLAFLWSLFNITSVTGGVFGNIKGIMIFFEYIFIAIIGLFMGGIIILVISSICYGSTDFEANVRVSAAILVVIPVAALLIFAGDINPYLGLVVTLSVSIFALWLLYYALIETLKTKLETTKIVIYILVAVFVLFMLLPGIIAWSKAKQMEKEINKMNLKELPVDAGKN
jgi:hypothetical protein